MNNITFISLHEHEILICLNFKNNKFNTTLKYQKLEKNHSYNYDYFEDESYLFLKCLKSGCDINPNRIKNDNYDPELIKERYLKYTSNPNYKKDIVFSLDDYYKIDKFDAFDDIILLGTKEELKTYFANKIASSPYNKDKIWRWLNILCEMNEKNIKILKDQKLKLNFENTKINQENQKLITENKVLKKNCKNLETILKDCEKIKNNYDNLDKEKKSLYMKCYELQNNLKKARLENNVSQNEIKNKDKELAEFKGGINFKIEKSSEKGEYDIVICIDSMHSLKAEGWKIKYPKGKEEYERKMKKEVIIVGVIGNRNKGKSFILQKLSDFDVKQGFSVVTEGLSLIYGEEKDHCTAILDSAGKESPLLNPEEILYFIDNNKIESKVNDIKEGNTRSPNIEQEESLKEEKKYEICLRDKLITETYIQRFIIVKSHILVLVVGNINLNEQKLLENVKSLLKNEQYLYVIHNLIELVSNEQVNDYIEGTLKNLFGIKLIERNFQDNKGDYYQNYYVEEKNQNVIHLIYVNENSSNISNYYNVPTQNFLKEKIKSETKRSNFSVIEECKKFLVEIGEQFIEEIITIDKFENENYDKIKLKNSENITLKKVFIDEIGITKTNEFDKPRYSYYSDEDDKILVVEIEFPGEGAELKTKLDPNDSFYIFHFIGVKPFDQSIIDKKPKIHSQNLKNKSDFKFFFAISKKEISIKSNDKGNLNYYEKVYKDGIFRFKYYLEYGNSTDFE